MNPITDEELRGTREKLLARDAELRDRVRRVRNDLERKHEPLSRDASDAAIMIENDEVLQAIEQSALRELAHIGHALDQLAAGTFGICEKCGKNIEPERLRAAPSAAHCRRCSPDS